jgi:hypothetical protein
VISIGGIITRGTTLQDAMRGIVAKYAIVNELNSIEDLAGYFGEATTHWRKLQDRVLRGVGNPCPLLLIGIPSNVVVVNKHEC